MGHAVEQISEQYRLSVAAQMAGLSSHQVRNYLQFRLVKNCGRSSAGHHRFDDDGVARLLFIGAAMQAGILIDELRVLVHAIDTDDAPTVRSQCEKLRAQVSTKQATMNRLSADLQRVRQQPALFRAQS